MRLSNPVRDLSLSGTNGVKFNHSPSFNQKNHSSRQKSTFYLERAL